MGRNAQIAAPAGKVGFARGPAGLTSMRATALMSTDGATTADAFVFFGATGDHARKMIFPALYRMVKRGTLDVPVIGVASSQWDLARFREHARNSITQSDSGIDDNAALDRLLSLLDYVDGDYGDAATFTAVRTALGAAHHPVHYLATPPALFATVIEGLQGASLNQDARVIVEKPFGRDLASAGNSTASSGRRSPRKQSSASTTTSARRRS